MSGVGMFHQLTPGRAFACYMFENPVNAISLEFPGLLSPLTPLKVQGDRSLVDIGSAVAHRWREDPLLRLREGLRVQVRAFGVLHRQLVHFAIDTHQSHVQFLLADARRGLGHWDKSCAELYRENLDSRFRAGSKPIIAGRGAKCCYQPMSQACAA